MALVFRIEFQTLIGLAILERDRPAYLRQPRRNKLRLQPVCSPSPKTLLACEMTWQHCLYTSVMTFMLGK